MTIPAASWGGTALFGATALAAVAVSAGPVRWVAFVVAVGLFGGGVAAFAAGYARAVRRSREALIGVAELFFLSGGVAPAPVRLRLLASLGAQVAIALGTAIARPYSSLAAGTLVPVYGLGLCGLWAARYGVFPPRPRR